MKDKMIVKITRSPHTGLYHTAIYHPRQMLTEINTIFLPN